MPVRPLNDARIRELLDGMPAFNERIRKLGRTKAGRKPLPLPPASSYPAGGLADVAATAYSEDPAEAEFYRDVIRMQELFAYVHTMPGSPRARVDGAIALLREQSAGILSMAGSAEMTSLYDAMIGSRIAELESITDDELAAVARFAPEIEKAVMQGVQSRKTRSKKKPKGG